MEFSDRKISIFKQFFNFMRFYNINYRAKNKADENVNLDYEKTYASLVNENRIFTPISTLNKLFKLNRRITTFFIHNDADRM